MPRVINLANLPTFTAVNSLTTDLGAIPGPVIVDQCAQIVLNWTLTDGKQGHNVLYGRYAGAFAGSVAQANSIHTALTTGTAATNFLSALSVGTALASVSIRDVNIIDQPLIQSTNPAAPGTASGQSLPNEVACVITLRTASVGRANRGRIYIPGFGTGSLAVGDTIAAATVTFVQAWANTIIGALSPSGYTLVIGHKARAAYTSPITGRSFPARPDGSITVTSLPVRDNHWDSQRRRGLK